MRTNQSWKWIIIAGLPFFCILLVRRFEPATPKPSVTAVGIDTVAARPVNPSPLIRPAPELVPAMTLSLGDSLSAALVQIEAETDPTKREAMIQALVEGVAAKDMPAVLKMLVGQDEPRGDIGRRLMRHWAESDPQAAEFWAQQLPPGMAREAADKEVALVLANNDLDEAINWVRQLPEGKERLGALTSLAYEASRTDPRKALTLAVEMPASQMRDELVRHTAAGWAESDPAAAAAWAKQIEDQPLRAGVLAGIATSWGGTAPVAAATLALETLPAGRQQDNAVVGILQRWAQQDPAQAAAWVGQFPEGQVRQAAVENLVKLWADKDMGQAAAWINGLPAGELRDHASGVLAGWLTASSPASAAKWAESITDENERQRQMEAVAASWLAGNAEGARAWITRAAFPDAVKARLLETARL